MFKKSLLIMLLMACMAPWAVGQTREIVYQKVTTAPDDWTAGSYLLVYDNSKAATNSTTTSGSTIYLNTVSVTVESNTIENPNGAEVITLELYTTGKYYIKNSEGKFLKAIRSGSGSTKYPQFSWVTTSDAYNCVWQFAYNNGNITLKWENNNDYKMAVSGNYITLASSASNFSLFAQANVQIDYPKPTGLDVTDLGSTTATLSWTAPTPTTGNTLTGYECQYSADGSIWTAATPSGTSCSISGLSAYTTYAFQVRAVYTDSESATQYSDWAEAPVTTACTIPTPTWNFDGSTNMPAGWTIKETYTYSTNYGSFPRVYSSASYAHSASNTIAFQGTGDQIVLMPAVNQSLNGSTVSFYAVRSSGYTTCSVTIGYYNASNEFVEIETKNITDQYTSYPNVDATEINISGISDDIRQIAIKGYTSSYYSGMYLDDVQIIVNNSCKPVSNLLVGTTTYASAKLKWTAGAGNETNWKLQYKTSAAENYTTVNVSSSDLDVDGYYTLSGLTQSTTYNWQVAAWCDTNDDDAISDYVAGENFSTPAQFVAPTNFEAAVAAHSATLSWDAMADATGYNVIYSENNNLSDPINTYSNVNATTQALTGLTKSHNYYAGVQAIYAGGTSAWVIIPFTTTSGVDVPTLTASNPTGNTIDLSWNAVSGNDNHQNYEVCYNTENSVPGTLTESTNYFKGITATSYQLTGLESTTTYYAFVRDNCGTDGNSAWSASAHETTTCGSKSLPYSYDFEDADPMDCWRMVDCTVGSSASYSTGRYGNSSGYNSTYSFRFYYNTSNVQYLISPEFTNTDNGVRVKLYYKGASVSEKFKVGYSTTDNNINSFTWDDEVTAATSYNEYSQDFQVSGIKYIAIQYSVIDKYYLNIDDIRITALSSCHEPTALAESNVRSNSATFTWTKGGTETNWTLQYAENNTFSTGLVEVTEGFTIDGTNVSYSATGLKAGQIYYVRVKANCSANDESAFCDAINFTTLAILPPTNLSVSDITTTSARLNWTGASTNDGHVRYEVCYSTTNSNPEEGTTTTNAYYDLTLQPGTTYYAWVRDICGTNSTWAAFGSFTTAIVVDYTHSFTEGFENSVPPTGWNNIESGSYKWTRTNLKYHDGSYCAYSGYYGPIYLVTPSIQLTNEAALIQLTFWSYTTYGNDHGSSEIFIYGDETKPLWSDTEFAESWNKYTVDLTEYHGQTIRLAFKYTGSNKHGWYIDDVAINAYDNAFTTAGNWNVAGNWATGSVATNAQNVLIDAACTIPATYTAQANNITLGENGSITIAEGGQLICNTSVEVKMQKSIDAWNADDKLGWYAISTPVHTGDNAYVTFSEDAGSNVSNLAYLDGENNKKYNVYYYDEANAQWVNNLNGDGFWQLNNGQGYIYRRGENATIEFKGNTNLSNVVCNLSYQYAGSGDLKGFNLLGNPYTHNITWDYISDVNNINEDGFYTIEEDGENQGKWTTQTTEGTIAPMQAFLVQATDNNAYLTINYNNAVRKSNDNNDNIMFAVKNGKYSDEAYVLFKEGHGLNKVAHRNAAIPMLYVINNGENFAIADMSDDTRVINLGFEAKTMSQYSISLKAQGNFSYMHLYDKLTGEDVDMLIEDSYSFIGTPNDRKDRFVLRLTYNASIEEVEANEAFVYQSGSDIIVNGEGELQVFDMMGRKVMTQHINGVETINMNANGVYIFKINDKVQKIVVR